MITTHEQTQQCKPKTQNINIQGTQPKYVFKRATHHTSNMLHNTESAHPKIKTLTKTVQTMHQQKTKQHNTNNTDTANNKQTNEYETHAI